MGENEGAPQGPTIMIRPEDVGGVWANFAAVSHSPYEFTIDFARLDFNQAPPSGIVVARINLSPLFVAQLMEALEANWKQYAVKALPKEMHNDDGSI